MTQQVIRSGSFVFLAWLILGTAEISRGQAGPESTDPLAGVHSFEQLDALAERLSQAPLQPRKLAPAALGQLDYGQYLQIRFRPEKAIWRSGDSKFWLETFHQGFVQKDQVSIYLIDNAQSGPLPFSAENFTYGPGTEEVSQIPGLGHAGLKIIGRLPNDPGGTELLTFLGSSYFRARSGQTLFGSSARGLATDISLPQDEEFPFFRAFWISKPQPDDNHLDIWALLDCSYLTGAYHFRLVPGEWETNVQVSARLHFRQYPDKLALAPLTSMWIWGDGLEGPPLDARPAVHDSDGLLLRTEGDIWIWRPFARLPYPSVTNYPLAEVRGFGLLQRNRSFYHFDDHNARYDLRPSVWVQPGAAWKDGSIELLELPGAHEGVDNIAAYWIPPKPASLEEPLELAYNVSFFSGDYKEETEVARITNLQVEREAEQITLTLRYNGGPLANLSAEQIDSDVRLVRGKMNRFTLEQTETGDYLVRLTIEPTENAPIEVQLSLSSNARQVAEQFRYLCPHLQPEFKYPAVYTRKE